MENVAEFLGDSAINVNQTYSFINNTGFYALANPIYFDYYFRVVRYNAWWYDKYVPDFHSATNGVFSTGLAHSLVDGIANQIVGRKMLLQCGGGAKARKNLKEAYKWAEAVKFTEQVRKLVKYAGALSTALLKLNVSNKGLWLEALRMDNFFFATDFKGNLTEVTCLINSYTDTNAKQYDWIDIDGKTPQMRLDNKFYLVERRFFQEEEELVNGLPKLVRVPYAIYEVKKYNGNILNSQAWNTNLQENYDYKSIPKNVRHAIYRDYGVIRIGEPQRLPFDDYLGCELYKYNENDASLPQQPFGESILQNIRAFLMGYDLAYSWFVRDLYQGKGIVFMAKELQTASSGMQALGGLEKALITRVQTYNDTGKLPIDNVQFDLRVAEWRDARNLIYENIATHLNISPTSIASFLKDDVARTAFETKTDREDTDNYIEIERGVLTPCLDRILKCVCKYYGWGGEISVKFSQGGVQNSNAIIERVIKLKQAGLITLRGALREIMVDADESEVDRAVKELEEYNNEQERKKADSMFNMDYGFDIGGENAN